MGHAERPDARDGPDPGLDAYWSRTAPDLLRALDAAPEGLTRDEAARRVARHGRNVLAPSTRHPFAVTLASRFRDPLIAILVAAAAIALLTGEWLDAGIVLAIVAFSALLGAVQEYRAANAVAALRRGVAPRATVLRDGAERSIAADEVVPGDVLRLSAGSLIPADAVLLAANDFFVSQGLLTGESLPVEKRPGVAPAAAVTAERANCVFMGTSVRSGTATAVVARTGAATAFGAIAGSLALRPPETEFERGLRQFGGMLLRVMAAIVIAVLGFNLLMGRPPLETLLFAMALAVGISPELLPAVLGVTLAHGARRMAARGVIVRRLNAIENLGSMDVLCTDKTGTLTRGVVRLDLAADAAGDASAEVLRLAALNATLQTGLANPLDGAIVEAARGTDLGGCAKLDEVPYDFARKRLSVVVSAPGRAEALLITKGAFEPVLAACERVQHGDRAERLDAAARAGLQQRFAAWSDRGFRVLALATRDLPLRAAYGRADEAALTLRGFLLFFDPPEPQVVGTLRVLRRMGVHVKVITGDNARVARHVASALGLRSRRALTGAELSTMSDEALWHLAPKVRVFAEVDPNQKERIIRALQKSGHVVGFLGDGINDAPALHAADVGISVDGAVDVAKEAADFVLLRHDLRVVCRGIEEGRQTFANTLKYIHVTTSANFGNMLSMALASVVLPFLPLLAHQVLLNNFLSDIPALGIAGDNVDREWRRTPHRWNIRSVRAFMLAFGSVSSLFDALTFGVLLALLGAAPEAFRTGWFVESLLTELVIIFVVRTWKPLWGSRPGRFLLGSALAVAAVTVALPYVPPLATALGFVPLPPAILALLVAITVAYALASEALKRRLFGRAALHRRIRAPPGD